MTLLKQSGFWDSLIVVDIPKKVQMDAPKDARRSFSIVESVDNTHTRYLHESLLPTLTQRRVDKRKGRISPLATLRQDTNKREYKVDTTNVLAFSCSNSPIGRYIGIGQWQYRYPLCLSPWSLMTRLDDRIWIICWFDGLQWLFQCNVWILWSIVVTWIQTLHWDCKNELTL